jgi:hypothetical protein
MFLGEGLSFGWPLLVYLRKLLRFWDRSEMDAKLSNEELAALDQIAWKIAENTFNNRGTMSSDMMETIDGYIEHFLMVRTRLVDSFISENNLSSKIY